MRAFSLLVAPHVVTVVLPCSQNAPLPLASRQVRDIGTMLEPRYIFRARPFDQ